MRTRTAHIIVGLLAAFGILLVLGCDDRHASTSHLKHSVNAKPDPAIIILEAKLGMAFPTNSILVGETDGGGRDPSYGFYAWGVFSPTAITMPKMKAPGVIDYLNLPLEDAVEFVQGKIHGQKIAQPQYAIGSEWETNGYSFRGTLVRTPQGDYIAIEQFRQK